VALRLCNKPLYSNDVRKELETGTDERCLLGCDAVKQSSACCLLEVFFSPENGGRIVLQNIGEFLLD
jgi:hypothetical protein